MSVKKQKAAASTGKITKPGSAKAKTKPIQPISRKAVNKPAPIPTTEISETRPASKSALILTLLRQTDGASLEELCEASGWQRHSVHGFLSGTVRKRLCLAVVSEKATDGVRRYQIREA